MVKISHIKAPLLMLFLAQAIPTLVHAAAFDLEPAAHTTGPLYGAILVRDAEFFQTYFLNCNPEKVTAMVTKDIEFYHDKGGVVATNADAFIADYTKSCTEKLKPDTWRSRRELVAGTMRVYPVPGYGAIELGDHVFYERKGEGPEKLVGKAQFTALWKQEDGIWKLARVFSYAHAPAGEEKSK
jgi:hypothetical protein